LSDNSSSYLRELKKKFLYSKSPAVILFYVKKSSCTDIEILAHAETWISNGKHVAIATVLDTWGSAPCPLGSCLIATSDLSFLALFQMGCIEAEVISEMQNII
jgi:XdhC and CoxI family